jgi:hypothetical protein
MSNIDKSQYSVTNLLVPAAGVVHSVAMKGKFTNVPEVADWNQFKVDNFPFIPQGVFMDNIDGTVDLVLTITPIGWRVICGPGQQRATNFPSPQSSGAKITGDMNNEATVVFVDFPVLPDTYTKI